MYIPSISELTSAPPVSRRVIGVIYILSILKSTSLSILILGADLIILREEIKIIASKFK
jgi:hypothetical protein